MYKLIAIDVDGTLLNSHNQVSEENIRNIRAVMEKGVKVIICSGRAFKGARYYAKLIGTKEPVITCNGAVIKDTENGQLIHADNISIPDFEKASDFMRREDACFYTFANDVMLTESQKLWSKYSAANNNENLMEEDRIEIELVEDICRAVREKNSGLSKIVVESKNTELLKRLREKVSNIDTLDIMSSGVSNIEIVNKGVSKGKALQYITESYGFLREEVIAIGDNENDCEMIRYAGLGVAMGNARTCIKELADHITATNDEHGVSEVLRKFVL